MKGFIEVTQVGHGEERFRKIIAVSEIISVTEIDGIVCIQISRDHKGRVLAGVQIAESYEKILSLISEDKK